MRAFARLLLLLSTQRLWAQPAAPDEAQPDLEQRVTELGREVADLKALVLQLQQQLLKSGPQLASVTSPPSGSSTSTPTSSDATAPEPVAPPPASAAGTLPGAVPPAGVTINAVLDGYYQYDVNSPVGRVNELRAYDVSSNSFSLNQADLIVERAADPAAGQRIGLRLDLQYGQATSTLQGNPANELRPEVYRNIFQAYGTYVFPVAAGLTVDFGKWASSLGIEGNYTKDQLNYSRSFWFDYLPFYHSGLRAKLAITDEWAVNLWIVYGTDQTEANNNYKDQMFGFVYTPTSALNWTVNYYLGQDHPDVLYLASQPPLPSNLPNQQGTYILPINNPPSGKLQIVDSYLTWQATRALLVAAETDYVQERLYSYSSPQRVEGGAVYAGYQLTPTGGGRARRVPRRYRWPIQRHHAVPQRRNAVARLSTRGGILGARRISPRSFQSALLPVALPGRAGIDSADSRGRSVWWFGQKTGAW